MNEKNKALVGLILCSGIVLYLIFAGLAGQYPIAVWMLGAVSGLAMSKLQK